MNTFSLCIYCGSKLGLQAGYEAAARRVGTLVAERGWQLVYGGGNAGLMGAVANSVLAAGGRVIGVIPKSLMDREHGHTGLHELHVVDTMHQRKQMMAERADAFLALPGGIGTFEELFEVWTWRQLGYHDKPVGLLNVEGYYDPLLAFLDQSVAQGFVPAAQHTLLHSSSDPVQLLDRLSRDAKGATAPDDYRKI